MNINILQILLNSVKIIKKISLNIYIIKFNINFLVLKSLKTNSKHNTI